MITTRTIGGELLLIIGFMRSYAFWRSKVRQRLQDPVKAEILAPIKPPHAFGTKRPSPESCYWETFNQSNVDLIDVNSDPIVEVTDRGVITASGRLHCLDILALATGFDFLTALSSRTAGILKKTARARPRILDCPRLVFLTSCSPWVHKPHQHLV